MGTLSKGVAYRVDGFDGTAFKYVGDETVVTDDTIWDGIEEPTGMVKMVMIGDHHTHVVDPEIGRAHV